ncbi:enolase C-terminal domain-like protein [Candidatus Latescibacterota bacterium]
MKITQTEFYPIATPRETGAVSLHLLIRVDTDEGISGWGERSDFASAPLAELPEWAGMAAEATRRIHGTDPMNVYGVLAGLEGLLTPTFEIALRDTFGWDLEITALDLSANYEWQDSLALLERLKPYQYQLAESVGKGRGDLEGMARVRERLGVPISEHLGSCAQVARFHEAGAADICNCSTHGKGVRTSKAILDFAHELGMTPLHGTTQELSVGTAAAAHVCAATRELTVASYPVGPVLYLEDCVTERIRYEHSDLVIPEGPGLGVEVDEEQLQRLRHTGE